MKIIALLIALLFAPPAWAGWDLSGGTSNDHWHIADNAVLDNADSDWTWAFFWRNDAAPSGADLIIFSNSNTVSGNPAFVGYCSNTSGPGNISVRNNDDATADQSTTSSFQECNTTGTWRRVIIEHSGNQINVYLDGSLIAASSLTVGAMSGPAGGLYWGIDPDNSNEGNYAYCDIAKWTRLLSAGEIASLGDGTSKIPYSAGMYPNSRTLWIPAIRDFVERHVPLTVTNSGATVVSCPTMIRRN